MDSERASLDKTISRLQAELDAARDKLSTLDMRLAERLELAEAKHKERLAKLDGDMQIAARYTGAETVDTTALIAEIDYAEKMRSYINEFKRMKSMLGEAEQLAADSAELTRKIELARELPSIILQSATLPLSGLTVENGIPLIKGLPVSNLSEGEKLNLCVDIALSNPSALQIILIDGTEKLSDDNRAKLYQRCKEKGLQFIATRTTNDDEMQVTVL